MCSQANTACVETSWHVASPILHAASPPTVLFKAISPERRNHFLQPRLGHSLHRVHCASSHPFFLHLSCQWRRGFFFTTELYDVRFDLFALSCQWHDAVFCGLRARFASRRPWKLEYHKIKHRRQYLRSEAANHSEFKPSGLVHETCQLIGFQVNHNAPFRK